MERQQLINGINGMPDGELKAALLVVLKYASEHGQEDRNSYEVSVHEDEDQATGITIGCYQF